jgi:RNA ligase (TIGR02306 family)
MRKLATIRKIKELRPIPDADAIELAIVDGWHVVVAKNVGHKEGDLVVYCEIDSFLPIEPEFEFLRKTSYKKMGDAEGFRLKTIKLRGQVSQGLIIPLRDAVEIIKRRNPDVENIGSHLHLTLAAFFEELEVTEMLGIVKYEPPIPAQLAGKVKGMFPSFIKKTDEERVQNLAKEYEGWKYQSEHQFYATEKLDGSSATFYLNDGVFGVCSRNLDLLETEDNTFWKVAYKLNIKEKLELLGRNVAIQGELIGEGIQGNPYKIKGHDVRFFNIYDIDEQLYFGLPMFLATMEHTLKLNTVPILGTFQLPETVEELLKIAEEKSILNPEFDREGLVIRSMDRTISFKAISNKFLLKEK